MAQYFGPYRPGSSPVAIFSGLGVVGNVAGRMGAEAGPVTRLGVVGNVAGRMGAEAGPRVQLGQVATVAGNMAAEVGPVTRLGRLGVVGNVAGRMGAEAGPVTRLGSPNVTRLGVVGNVAGRMGAEAGPVTRLGAVRPTEGNFAAEVGPITQLGMAASTRLGSPMVSSLGRPTAVQLGAARAKFASFYGFGADEGAGFTQEQIDCLASQGEDVSAEEALANCAAGTSDASGSWTADEWAKVIKSIGGAIDPVVSALTGQLVNPRTGQPLTPQQIAAYRQYQSAQQKQGLPAWAIPAGIAAVAVVAIVLLRRR